MLLLCMTHELTNFVILLKKNKPTSVLKRPHWLPRCWRITLQSFNTVLAASLASPALLGRSLCFAYPSLTGISVHFLKGMILNRISMVTRLTQ